MLFNPDKKSTPKLHLVSNNSLPVEGNNLETVHRPEVLSKHAKFVRSLSVNPFSMNLNKSLKNSEE